MDIKFNCPNCDLVMQASADCAGGTVQCPECGQEFGVEASPPVMPVVKARAVPAPAPLQVSPSPTQPRSRPQQPRPGPAAHPHAPEPPKFKARPTDDEASRDKLRFIGLGIAAILLVILVVWVMQLGSTPTKNSPNLEKIAAEERAIREHDERIRAAELKIRQKKQEEEEFERKIRIKQEEQDRMVREEKAEHDATRDEYARKFFTGDIVAADAFIKVVNLSIIELIDWINESTGGRTKADVDQHLVDLLIKNFEREPMLSQWMKDHNRDPRKIIRELVHSNPQRRGPKPQPNAFDFTQYASSGTGFCISSDGWILTNEHVVTDAKVVDLRLRDGKILEAKVVKTDVDNDLALLKADLGAVSWLAVSKGDTELRQGHTVFTVGYPDPVVQGVESKFTDGRVSSASGIGDRKDSYQTTVPVQHGNSGGPLVDLATGWVVGVVNARLEKSGAENVSYAIKGKLANTFYESVPEAKAAVSKNPPKPLTKGDERAVIDSVTDSSILILRKR